MIEQIIVFIVYLGGFIVLLLKVRRNIPEGSIYADPQMLFSFLLDVMCAPVYLLTLTFFSWRKHAFLKLVNDVQPTIHFKMNSPKQVNKNTNTRIRISGMVFVALKTAI